MRRYYPISPVIPIKNGIISSNILYSVYKTYKKGDYVMASVWDVLMTYYLETMDTLSCIEDVQWISSTNMTDQYYITKNDNIPQNGFNADFREHPDLEGIHTHSPDIEFDEKGGFYVRVTPCYCYYFEDERGQGLDKCIYVDKDSLSNLQVIIGSSYNDSDNPVVVRGLYIKVKLDKSKYSHKSRLADFTYETIRGLPSYTKDGFVFPDGNKSHFYEIVQKMDYNKGRWVKEFFKVDDHFIVDIMKANTNLTDTDKNDFPKIRFPIDDIYMEDGDIIDKLRGYPPDTTKQIKEYEFKVCYMPF